MPSLAQVRHLLLGYPGQRVLVGAISFGAVIFGARLLAAEAYSLVLQAMFVAKFLQILNLGAINGYFVSRYSNTCVFADADSTLEARYISTLSIHLSAIVLPGFILAFLFESTYTYAIAGFIALIPIVAMEPVFRYRRIFAYSLLPDALLASSLILVFALKGINLPAETTTLFMASLFTTAFLVTFLSLRFLRRAELPFPVVPLKLSTHFQIMRTGFPVFIGTLLFVLASSMERLFLPLYAAPQQIASYYLAYQLSVGGLLFVSATNFMNVVQLGQKFQKRSYTDGVKTALVLAIRRAFVLGLISVLALYSAVTILDLFFLPDTYQDLPLLTLFLSSGLAAFYVCGSVTPILGYLKRQAPASVAIAVAAMILFFNNWLTMEMNFGTLWLAGIVAATLIGYSIWGIIYTFHCVNVSETETGHEE